MVHVIYYQDGAKMMRPVLTREEYISLRNSSKQQRLIKEVRQEHKEASKRYLVQMNYSCMPNADGTLKGSTTPSNTVGMDIDHLSPTEMEPVKDGILQKAAELGLLMMERSARGEGYHLVFKRRPELSQEDNLRWASDLIGVPYDEGAKDITRVFFTTTEEDLIYLNNELFNDTPAEQDTIRAEGTTIRSATIRPAAYEKPAEKPTASKSNKLFPLTYHNIPFSDIIKRYWEVNNQGYEPTQGDRDTLTYQLACDLRHICGKNFDWLDQVIPCYDGFSLEEKREKIRNALSSEYNGFPIRLRNTLNSFANANPNLNLNDKEEHSAPLSPREGLGVSPLGVSLPLGASDSVAAVGQHLAMPVVTAICPCIGALATGVRLDVHGTKRGLNLIAYIAGDFASGKGQIDPVVEAWMSEQQALDKMYQTQEDEWRQKKRAAKNKKEQPEEPKLPVRCLTLNNTVANLAERLANTEGKHAFSFTPEADTVAQKWKSSLSDFSVMLRQSYDGSRYDREARSAEAVNVHIDSLLWNVVMCGTPDALYRVVSNYTDGFQSRIAVASTPDNTFSPLEAKPCVLTDRQRDRIQQVAHLLPLMHGEVVLPKLEQRGREWLEKVRLDSMMNDDRTRARQRFRVCVTAQRMTCCLMLCRVCDQLIRKHGLTGAETQLKQYPNLWKEMLLKAQTAAMLEAYDQIADYLLDTALYYFRERIENAFQSRDYVGTCQRRYKGKNDSIYERLDVEFTFEQAMQQSVAIKGAGVSRNSVHQMLKNWRKQGLAVFAEDGKMRKL